jgi:hypothetical protein
MGALTREAPIDIVIRGGFNDPVTQLDAVSDLGREIMAKAYGFACIGVTVRKSAAGGAIWQLRTLGAHVAPEAFYQPQPEPRVLAAAEQ